MTRMLCRNKVTDFQTWRERFDSQAKAHRNAGLTLEHLWRCLKDSNHVFFVFRVSDIQKGRAFFNARSSAKAGNASGVIDGEFWFVESAEGD